MLLKSDIQKLLREYDTSKLNLNDDIVAERILMFGDKDITDKWIKRIGKEKAQKLFEKNSFKLDKKSINYWNIIFDTHTKTDFNNNRSIYEQLNKPSFSRNIGQEKT